ncbi:cystathionine beta-synthase-like isoform X2 [Sitophilus oryzae]|nr:cystathionine beta-synthase-like isoform X2 [Sitophilus oryzae]XP_030752762.1 cystathionine beta-synthase-like isoform X2 [Sitophilus oryzae]XP_030752763.1 cystathionine beta-synthase-like isoform X2 [Sitophilus oryzae]XP_030752764.1 cystathionine beta-synthase-like isoform X2 [Sitophilus oryzae]
MGSCKEKNEVKCAMNGYSNHLGCTVDDDRKIVYVAPINGKKFVIPDATRQCTWTKDALKKGVFYPHSTQDWKRTEKIVPNVLSLIGNTPMVKLNSIPKKAGIKCNIYAKLEYFNPGGSVKDRIAKRIIEDAEAQGLLRPGMTIIEATSGNTGIGVALASAIKGYKCIIVMSEKMSNEKVAVITALGAKLIKTPITADSYSTEGIFGVANRLHNEIPDSLILDQFSNPGNPLAHYDTTAEEILDQCNHKVDYLVLGAGTGGTLTGISRKIKEKSPQTTIVGLDPEGSVFAVPDYLNKTDVTFFEVEGLGYDFVPTSLDQNAADIWVKTNDQDSLTMARRLIREEGILCGTSSGAAVSAAIKIATDVPEGANIVVVIPDSIRNYLTKFVSDHWMEARGFQSCENINNHWWWKDSISSINYKKVNTVRANESCGNVIDLMRDKDFKEVAVLKLDGNILGTVTLKHLINNLLANNIKPSDKIQDCTIRIFPKVDVKSGYLGLVSRILEKDHYVIVTETNGTGYSKTENPLGIIKITDLYEYIQNGSLS